MYVSQDDNIPRPKERKKSGVSRYFFLEMGIRMAMRGKDEGTVDVSYPVSYLFLWRVVGRVEKRGGGGGHGGVGGGEKRGKRIIWIVIGSGRALYHDQRYLYYIIYKR